MSEQSEELLDQLADVVPPEVLWRHQQHLMPETMKRVDAMLDAGMTPEWIVMRSKTLLELPHQIQTALLNALHWRQAELKSKGRVVKPAPTP